MIGRTKTPISKKAVVQIPKSGDSGKAKVEHSHEENIECLGKDEPTIEVVGGSWNTAKLEPRSTVAIFGWTFGLVGTECGTTFFDVS